MAGLSLFGDLTDALSSSDPVVIRHRLESVKLIPKARTSNSDPEHHGHLTEEAVSRPEIVAPDRNRVFEMPVTARDNRDRGRPSAWSAALDKLASDMDDEGQNRRLLIVSAGNAEGSDAWKEYPDSNDSDGIHDPAQAWNVLTVGACTDLVKLEGPYIQNSKPIANKGALSPFSTTSLTWGTEWPLKPDILFERGNVAQDYLVAGPEPSLSLLTTPKNPTEKFFTTTYATSAATALASRMAAQIMAEYPDLWPETVRALIVHSAEWTDAMKKLYLPQGKRLNKKEYSDLVRRCGFGKPDLETALWSVANSLTMVAENSLQPFKREVGKLPEINKMNLHRLPWPEDALRELGEAPVEMRVTLSYFIEPNPSARGFKNRYSYESHGLRFDVKRPTETLDEFRKRVNKAARSEGEGGSSRASNNPWLLGTQERHKGSLHGDIWSGTATDLADCGSIAVYPSTGWWKTRQALERYNRSARYALVVSIRAPRIEVDLYSEVANQISVVVGVGS